MRHPIFVAVVDDACHLREDGTCIDLAEVPDLFQPAEKLSSFTEAAWGHVYSSTRKKLSLS